MTALSGIAIRPAARRALLAYLILLLVYGCAVAVNREFLAWGTLRLQLVQATFIGLIAIGETLAILIGQIDLSVPWTITLSAILSTNLASVYGHQWVAFAVVIMIGVSVGLLNTLGVFVLRVHSLIWTLSVNLMLQGITLVYTNAVAPTTHIPGAARALALGNVGVMPAAFLVWIACGGAAIVALRRMPFGRSVYAIGNSPAASLLSGVPVGRVHALVFITSALCAAFVGLLLSGYASQAYLGMGNDYLLPPIAAVVIGGTRLSGGDGGYAGSIAGALTVVLLQAILVTLNISEGARQLIFGAILLALALLFLKRRT
ncbi:ABC transporter permease [Acidocella sp. C78]|uniref:ABC transporter permease n=1 Tax=Acidocella sp. C78 TaxID=1671486 RepID=UPI0020BFC34D|nr:ABC transporter permease [Acidocella sp. C78]